MGTKLRSWPRAEVGVHVAAHEPGQGRVADDEAPGDCASAAPGGARVLEHRELGVGEHRPFEQMVALVVVPAEVGALGARHGASESDLLPDVLADVTDRGRPCPVEREPPRVAAGRTPRSRPSRRVADERVVGGTAYGLRAGAVDPQHLAEQPVEVLPVAVRVAAPAPYRRPVAVHSMPSGPNCSCPPLWFAAPGWRKTITLRALLSSASVGSVGETLNSLIWLLPAALVK